MTATKTAIIKSVLRLLAAIALYILATSLLEFYVDWFFGLGLFSFTKFEEVTVLKAKHTRNDIAWKGLDLSLKITNTAVIKTTRCLNFIFGVNKFSLEFREILTRL